MLGNLDKLKAYKQQLDNKASNSTEAYKPNENFIQFKPGNSYRFRLIYSDPTGSAREKINSPFINRYVHKFKDADEQNHHVVCPTSEYFDGEPGGFKKCPICTANSANYKKWEKNKSATTRALFDTFKRQFSGFALVYVVADGYNESNNGQVRIMRYGKKIQDFLSREIFGIIKKGEAAPADDPYFGDAFDPEEGFDLILNVTENVSSAGTFNNYTTSFSRGKSSINVDMAELSEQIKACEFDKELCTLSTYDDIDEFYRLHMLNESYTEPSASSSVEEVETIEDAPKAEVKEVKPVKATKTKAKSTAKKEPAPVADEDDEFDIDSISALVDSVSADIA
jgi:hypothetical protein